MKHVTKTALAALAVGLALAAPARAADLGHNDGGMKDEPSLYSPDTSAANWTGPYIGVYGGWAWGGADQRETNGGVDHQASYDVDGAFGGATVGYNRQFWNVVVGIEGELGYMGAEGEGTMASSNPHSHQNLNLDGGLYGVAAARLGIAIDRTLVYGKGGYGYFDGEASQDSQNPGFGPHTVKGTDAFSGFVYGGGVEQKLGRGLSVKIEYLHFDFGKEGGSQTGADGFEFTNETKLELDTIKAGLNYKF